MKMRVNVPFLASCLSLALLSCDQALTSSKDQPLVDYVLVVTDSVTAVPLDSVRVHVTSISGDTSTYFTDAVEGRVELASVASSRTLFVLSRQGYRTLDFIDTVNALPDTVFHRPLTRLLNLKLANLGLSSSLRIQYNMALRDENLEKLGKGQVSFVDSTGIWKTLVDTDSDGTVGLSGLKIGETTRVRVEHPGYLGRLVDVKVDALADTAHVIPGNTLILLPLANSISGHVYYKTALGSKALVDAGVEFKLKDSLAYPSTFRTLTSSQSGEEGSFLLANVPALQGDMRYFKNKTTVEPASTQPITQEEVELDGPLAPVTLTISQDSLLPEVVTFPKDTLSPKDTLVFTFNQPVDVMDDPIVSLVNVSPRVYIWDTLDATRRILKIVQKEDDWTVGDRYDYQLRLLNSQGTPFTLPGDTLSVIRGSFYVKAGQTSDSALVLPQNVRVAYFNSGSDRVFDSFSDATSPKADSTTRFARMKWSWSSLNGNRVDSLLVFIKDGGEANPTWRQWVEIPGFADSATLDFTDFYSTSGLANSKPAFPPRASAAGEVQLKLLFLEGGKILDSTVFLAPVRQDMGPTVYVAYDTLDGLRSNSDVTDTVEASFRTSLADPTSAFDFGTNPPKPITYLQDVQDSTHLSWKWIPGSGKTGRLIYSFRSADPPPPFTRMRVDLNGVLWNNKPIWQRNRKSGVGFD